MERQPARARCGSTIAGDGYPNYAVLADTATRSVALVLGINTATDNPYGYTNRTAGPSLGVDRYTPSPVIGRPAGTTRGIRRSVREA
jgi:hypothetical protein